MSRSQAAQPEAVRTPQTPEAAPAPAGTTPAGTTPAGTAPAATAPPTGPVAIPMHLSELKAHHVSQLVEMAVSNGIENASRLRKQDLIFALLKSQAKKGVSIFGDGT